jgi:hypothetical protein
VRQQGLRYAMEQLRSRIVSNNEGSAALTDERLRQGTGMTLDDFINDQRDVLLMKDLLETKVRSRVNISWQQVKNEWERRYQEAQKQKTVRFRVIAVPKQDTQAAAQVTSSLESGTSFIDLSETDVNKFEFEGRRYMDISITGEVAEAKPFGPDALNKAAQQLSVGQTAGPIELPNSLYWIHFEKLVVRDVKSLYEAQLEIIEELRNAGTARENGKYFGRLIEKSSLTPISDMEQRLLSIAVSRYAPRKPQ